MTPRTLVVAAAALAIGAGVTLSQDDARPRRQPPRDGEGRARMLEQFDTDGDGRLSEAERAAAREQRRGDRPGAGQRGEGPRDGRGEGLRDGSGAGQRGDGPRDGRGEGLRDGSGAGQRGEGPRDGRGAGFRGERGIGPRDGLMAIARFDTDNDGKLSDEEIAVLRAEYEARHQEMLREFDTDGDGQLSPEERRAAFGPRRGPRDGDAPAAVEGDDARPRGERRDRPRRRADR